MSDSHEDQRRSKRDRIQRLRERLASYDSRRLENVIKGILDLLADEL